MTNLYLLILLIFLGGCSTNGVNLTPTNAIDNEYITFYDFTDVSRPHLGIISSSIRNRVYEKRVNLILQSDPFTSTCEVIEGSVNFGEPGSVGSAKVKCANSIPLVKDGMVNLDGSPSYRYFLKNTKN